MNTKNLFRPLISLVVFLVMVSLACSSGTAPQSPSNSSPKATATKKEVTTPKPSNTPKPTNTPRPTNTSTPVPLGLSRSNPFPRSDIASAPNWDIQILEVKRGDAAWSDLQAANMFNNPAPEGMEYILIKLHIKNTYADSEEHHITSCDFSVTGDKAILYTCGLASVVPPEPNISATLFSGGETEGWVAYLVTKDEGNLELVIDEGVNFEESTVRYIALDDGASISIPTDLASIKSNNLGDARNNPAPFSEKVITDKWEISILQAIRGEEAWKMVQEANQFNDLPSSGMEYVAVKVHVRYIGTTDTAQRISTSFFRSTGSANVLYDVTALVDPTPDLNVELYPGGEYEGWVVVQVAVGETDIKLVFEPLFDFSGDSTRYISLEQ